MERIERALEVARLHRRRQGDAIPASVVAPAGGVATPSFSEALAEGHPTLRLEDAPLAPLPARDVLRERCVVFPDEPGLATAAYKMLRTQVLQRARQHGMRSIGVVSPASGEGKTLTAINLALSLAAEPNQSVILVDLDLRKPSIATTLGLEGARGLECHFSDQDAVETVWRRYASVDRLVVVPTLAPVPNSSEILAGPVAGELMRTLRGVSADPLVLVDLPPALLSDDVLTIAPLLDGVVLVVTAEQTRREDLQRVFELLRSTPVIGTVLNASAEAEARAY